MKGCQASYRLARSGFARSVIAPPAGGTRLLIVADSIFSLETKPRGAGGMVKRWRPSNWTGWGVQGLNNTSDEAFVVFKSYAGSDMTFNLRSPNTGVGGGSLTPTSYFAGACPCNVLEMVCGATPPANDTEMLWVQPQAAGTAPWRNGTWWRNQPIRARLIYVVKNNDNWSLKVNGTRDGSAVIEALTDAADAGDGSVELRTLDVSCGTPGPGETPRLSVRLVTNASNATRTVGILGVRFYVPNARHGLEAHILASSGWGWLDHSSTSNCSDAIMQSYLDALDINAAMFVLGANLKNTAGNRETGGGNLEVGDYTNFKANALNGVNRFRTLRGNVTPALATMPLCLVSQYKTSVRTDTEMLAMCKAYYEIADAGVNIGYLNGYGQLSGHVIKANESGNFVHPTAAGAEGWLAGMWNMLVAADRGDSRSGGGSSPTGSTAFFPGGKD